MQKLWRVSILVLALSLAAACAPQSEIPRNDESRLSSSRIQRTLVILSGAEAPTYASKALQALGGTGRDSAATTVLNAELVYLDELGLPQLYLAEALPELNTDTWQVFPDGRMETTYRLKPNLTWHDGHPLTADDFVFAWQVYATPSWASPRARVAVPSQRSRRRSLGR